MMKEYEVFIKSRLSIEDKLRNFSKYVRRQDIARFIAIYELCKIIHDVKGSVIECGVHLGGVMSFAKILSNLEPIQIHREIIGFDTFEGFTSMSDKDYLDYEEVKDRFKGNIDIYSELQECIKAFDENRFLSQYSKVKLIKGNATKTIPEYVEKNPHTVVALLFLDFDLYEPTKVALEYFYPRIPKGGVLVFDEINNPFWKGETIAALEFFKNFNKLKLRKFPFDPNISYCIIGE